MIFSAQQLFSDNQAVVASTVSDNVIDLGVPGTPYGAVAPLNDDIGKGSKIPILVQVTEDFDNLTSLELQIVTGVTAGALNTVIIGELILLADLIAGRQFVIDVLPNNLIERYLGVFYVVDGTVPSVGRMTAGITMGNQTNVTGA